MACEEMSAKPEQRTPLIGEVIEMAPKLNEWASMGAHSFGLYSGINAAIAEAPDKFAPIVLHADELRMTSAMLCMVRIFATIDRGSAISLQSVNRFLKTDAAASDLAAAYFGTSDSSKTQDANRTCELSIHRFKNEYARINWSALGRLQSFRNSAIAHISWGEVDKFVTFGELEALVEIVGQLAGETSLMTSGLNNWPHEHQESAHDNAKHKWSAIFAADHLDRIDY
ncbi:conserved hypothetical protein [Mesorhizobium escarrei]|uniref:HEPN AbiU2-like domain-containing protein n=2 Tax=Mesorhizobium escarrei TaxID=666018 RepID=A0ABN8KGD6_9HYPH|nr:conserved hypothetical protein [Mesorhizobium escarrei]